jgi:hypothetical protein
MRKQFEAYIYTNDNDNDCSGGFPPLSQFFLPLFGYLGIMDMVVVFLFAQRSEAKQHKVVFDLKSV